MMWDTAQAHRILFLLAPRLGVPCERPVGISIQSGGPARGLRSFVCVHGTDVGQADQYLFITDLVCFYHQYPNCILCVSHLYSDEYTYSNCILVLLKQPLLLACILMVIQNTCRIHSRDRTEHSIPIMHQNTFGLQSRYNNCIHIRISLGYTQDTVS